MSENFILEFIPQRIAQLGYNKYHIRYRDLVVEPVSAISISAYNELFFIVDNPLGFIVESDYGVFDSTDNQLAENSHQHRGEIVIRNTSTENNRIKFIQIIIVN